jgi:hypothetical protein
MQMNDLHCYLHWSYLILPFLDDFWDFLTKSPPWYLISGRQKICCFCILLFQGPSGHKNDRVCLQCYYIMRSSWRGWSKQEEPRGTKEHGWRDPLPGRATRARLALERHLVFVFLWMPSFRWKRDARGGGGGTLFPPPKGLICYCHRMEIAAIVTSDSLA